jgi:hypothetical protein
MIPSLWPSRRREPTAGRALGILPLALPVTAWAPILGPALALGLWLAVCGAVCGAVLTLLLHPAPSCRQVWTLHPTVLRGQFGHWRDHRLPMLLAKDDGAVFELPAELQADRLEIELHGAQMAGQSTGGLAQLQLRWRRDGTDQARDVSIGPGAEQIVIPLPESKLSAAVSLLRTSSEGPPVAIGHRGVRVRGSAPRSLWLNTAFAFLSLWPPWLAAAAVLWA